MYPVEIREDMSNYWPFAMAVIFRKWQSATPLQKFLMLNTHPLWDDYYYSRWEHQSPLEKERVLEMFWDRIQEHYWHRMRGYYRGDYDVKIDYLDPVWYQRPPQWKKWLCILPWDYILTDNKRPSTPLYRVYLHFSYQSASRAEKEEKVTLWYLDRLAMNVQGSAETYGVLEVPTYVYQAQNPSMTSAYDQQPIKMHTQYAMRWEKELQDWDLKNRRFWNSPQTYLLPPILLEDDILELTLQTSTAWSTRSNKFLATFEKLKTLFFCGTHLPGELIYEN